IMDVYPPGSRPYGKSIGEWSEVWIRWALSIPKIQNPAADISGMNSGRNQIGPVFFLAGTFGGSVKRKCNVPLGKSIFFPIIEKECSFTEDYDLSSEVDLSRRAAQFIDHVLKADLYLDGLHFADLEKHRAHSRVFDLVFPENNVYGVAAGKTRSVT